jgi:hypothetical protein
MMIDACTVHRPGDPVTNPVTGKVTRPEEPIYTGPCQFQQTIAQAAESEAGEHEYTTQDVVWKTPVTAGPFQVNDVVRVTASGEDPHMVGGVYRVTDLFNKTYATSQRCRVEVVTS